MIKLVAIDLDGTLLRDDKTISDENKRAIARAKKMGVKVVICTGRPLKAIQHILEELDLNDMEDYSITFNGGLVQKNGTGEMLIKKTMPLEEIKEIYAVTSQFDLPTDILSDAHVYQLPCIHESWYLGANPFLTFSKVELSDLDENGIYNKIVSAFKPDALDGAVKKFPQTFKDKFEIIKSRDMLLEFMTKGITKAYGLQKLSELLNIKQEEIMAIGDEENDLPMIQYAGIGVAMENAVPLIKENANEQVATNMENGVAEAFERFVF